MTIDSEHKDIVIQLRQSRVALAQLEELLATSTLESVVLRQEIDALVDTNSRLKEILTNARAKAASASHSAYHDELTGLPNRRLLLDRLKQAISNADRQKKQIALIFIDVDNFKGINDQFGHTTGDMFLRTVAQRLRLCLRGTDTACRYGGDEFIVMLPEVDGDQGTEIVEKKIRSQLLAPYVIDDGSALQVTLSMGTAVYPVDSKNVRELIGLADAAMYLAKSRARETMR